MKPQKAFLIPMIILVAALILPMAAAAQNVKVAVMPFQIHAEKDYPHIQNGMMAMLTARLSAPDQMMVIDPLTTSRAIDQAQGLTGDSLAMAVGAAIEADFILNGSMTIFGESISIDAKILNITGTRPPLTVFKLAQGMGQLIPQINLLSADIVSQILDYAPSETAPAPVATPKASENTAIEKKKIDIHAHPEKLLEELRSGSDEQ